MTFNLFYKGKGFEDLKMRESNQFHLKNKEVNDIKKNFKDLKARLKKLNNLFQKKEKDPPSKLLNSTTYSKNRSYELNAKKYKSGKNSPRKYDFDSNYENLEKKISNLKRNFNMKGKILECDKQIVNQSNEDNDDSSDINLDEITDSIISITKHNNQHENNSRIKNNNEFYLDVDMTYIKDKETNFTPRTNGSKFVNQFQEKALLNDSYKLLSKISSTKTDYIVERSIIPDIKVNNSKELDNKINEDYNILSENDYIPTNPNKNVYQISQNIFNNINCFPENRKEKTPIKLTKSHELNNEMEDVDFEISDLTANQKADDSIEVARKRSIRSTRKFKKESLVIQNENLLSIIGSNDLNYKNEIRDDTVKEVNLKVIENLTQLEIEGKKEIHEVETQTNIDIVNEDRKLFNYSNTNVFVNVPEDAPIEKQKTIDIIWVDTDQENQNTPIKSVDQIPKIQNENERKTEHILIINDQKKKVNFVAESKVINLKENRRVMIDKYKSSANNIYKPRNAKNVKSILKNAKKQKEEEDPFRKLHDLIRECEIEENKSLHIESEKKKPVSKEKIKLVPKYLKYIDEVQKKKKHTNIDSNKKELTNHSNEVRNNNTTLPISTQIEESRFENMTPHKKEVLIKNCILKVNLESLVDNLEKESKKILEEEIDCLSPVCSGKTPKQEDKCFYNNEDEVIKKSSSNPVIGSKNNSNHNSNANIKIAKSFSSRIIKIINKPPTPVPRKSLLIKKSNKFK